MANVQFTINNVSASSVTYQGQTITAGNSYTPTAVAQMLFASDPGLIADILNNKVSISIGGNTLNSDSAIRLLMVLNSTTLIGGTDQTPIGNVGDSLKTTGAVTVTSGSSQYYLDQGQMFTAGVTVNAASSTTDNGLVYFRNPAGSGKEIFIVKILIGSEIANVTFVYKIFKNPTISANGTAIATHQANIGLTSTPVALLTSLPTVTSATQIIAAVGAGQNTPAAPLGAEFNIALQPNNSILITGNPASNNRAVSMTIVWIEVPV